MQLACVFHVSDLVGALPKPIILNAKPIIFNEKSIILKCKIHDL